MKQNQLFSISLLFILMSCDFKSKPYLKHKMAFKKIGLDCSQQNIQVSSDANTLGERYVFQECLAAGFDGNYNVQRRGDTVEVKFDLSTDKASLYEITLDINTRPAYHFLTINGTTMAVTVARD